MKRIFFYLMAGLLLTSGRANAQSSEMIIRDAVNGFFNNQGIDSRTAHSNQLMQTMDAPPDEQWAIHYYVALTRIILSYSIEDTIRRNEYMQIAEDFINEVEREKRAEEDTRLLSEIMIVQAMWHVSNLKNSKSVTIREASKKEAGQLLKSALKFYPNNPRAEFTEGLIALYSSQKYRENAKKAIPHFIAARLLFAREDKGNIFVPYWGFDINEQYVHVCEQLNK